MRWWQHKVPLKEKTPSPDDVNNSQDEDEMPKATPKRPPPIAPATLKPLAFTKGWGAWSKKKTAKWGTEGADDGAASTEWDNDWNASKKRKTDTSVADAGEATSSDWKSNKKDWGDDNDKKEGDKWEGDKWKKSKWEGDWKADTKPSKDNDWKADTKPSRDNDWTGDAKPSKDNDWKTSEWESSDWNSWKGNDWKEGTEKVKDTVEASKTEPPQQPPQDRKNPSRLPDKTEGWEDAVLQKRLFPDLPPLPRGWLRCCTRSMPHEMYYYNKLTCGTTFEIADVIKNTQKV